jgi:cell division control protein 7
MSVPSRDRLDYTTRTCATEMAKARTVQQRHGDAIDVHYDDVKEEDAEETLDESADPLDESGRTIDTSDEEVDDNVADELTRFADTFVGIDKRYRLINRIGEGEWRNWLDLCRANTCK